MSNPDERFSAVRAIALAIPLIVIAAITLEFTDIYRAAASSDLNGLRPTMQGRSIHVPAVPPAIVYGLFVPLLVLCAAIGTLRRRWRVTRGELVVVFCMLFVAVPVMGAGFWHQFAGIEQEYVRLRQLTRAMSSSPNLWPNHGNLLEGASVEDEPTTPRKKWSVHSSGQWSITDSPDGPGKCARIEHGSDSDSTRIELELDKAVATRFLLPLVRYAVYVQLRLDEPGLKPTIKLFAGRDRDHLMEIKNAGNRAEPAVIGSATRGALLTPDAFINYGQIDYQVDRELGDRFLITVEFSGKGTLYARNFTIIETEQVYRYFEGYEEATPQDYEKIAPGDRAVVRLKPDSGTKWWQFALVGRVPWRAWSRPLAIWGLLVVGTFLAMYCLVVIFFHQWEERDRLTFPLQTFLLDLTRENAQGRLVLMASMPFWMGLAISIVYLSLQQLNTFYPEVPAMHLSLSVPDLLPAGQFKDAVGSVRQSLMIDIRPAFVAVAFLMSLEMSLSMLVFFFLGLACRLVAFFTPLHTMRLGRYAPQPLDEKLLAGGGLLFMACYCVFAARKHLVSVARRVFSRREAADDSPEVPGYRWAGLGLVVSGVMIFCFAVLAELNPLFVGAFMLILLLLAVSAARIRAETGLPHLGIVLIYPQQWMVALGGVMVLGYRQMIFTCQSTFMYIGAFLMTAPILAESMAAARRTGVPLNKLTPCLFASFIFALVVGGVVYLSWAYTIGSSQMKSNFVAQSHFPYRRTNYLMNRSNEVIREYYRDHPDEPAVLTPERKSKIALYYPMVFVVTGISFAITGLLALARAIWLGFPLHPLGFALAFTPAINSLWPSIAVGHLVKRLGLRFGGVALNRAVLRPFFGGLFVGDLLSLALWRVLDSLWFGSV